jgi:hypothetical protein
VTPANGKAKVFLFKLQLEKALDKFSETQMQMKLIVQVVGNQLAHLSLLEEKLLRRLIHLLVPLTM